MKTKLISLNWRGTASVDPRFSAAMLPWTIYDICSMDTYNKLSVGVENGLIETYNSDFELQFSHHLKYIFGICRILYKNGKNVFNQVKSNSNNVTKGDLNFMEMTGPLNGIVYLLKDPRDPLLHIFLYESDSIEEMAELMHQMRDPVHTLGGSIGNIPHSFASTSGSTEFTIQKTLKNHGHQSTPASNLKLSEALRNAQPDISPNIVSSKMTNSKSYTHGLSNSAGTVNISASKSSSANLSLLSDISPNHSHFFEVMYVGKIRVSHKRVPFTFIDDALPKFKAFDAHKTRLLQIEKERETNEMGSCGNLSTTSSTNNDQDNEGSDESAKSECHELKIIEDNDSQKIKINSDIDSNEVSKNLNKLIKKPLIRGQSQIVIPVVRPDVNALQSSPPKVVETIPKQRDRSASYGAIPQIEKVEQNRTMVFLVGKSDLRLISPDRKQVLLYKDFKDVASCAQGHKNADHFGIICRELNKDGYIGYVFKCQSDHVADDIVAAISQAFIACSEQKTKEKSQIFSCEHCPMLWYHKLCTDIEGLNDKKTQTMIFRRIESLNDDEQDMIWAKFHGAEKINNNSITEQNQFLMMLLRAHCESRQQRHIHDTAENRTEFLNQYLGGSTIFMKAKRSLTSSFDHLLKRRGSKDDTSHTIRDIHVKEFASDINNSEIITEQGTMRPRSNTIGPTSSNKPNSDQLKSPMMDIFFKVGNSPKENKTHQGSWRQAILNSVTTPSKTLQNVSDAEYYSPLRPTVHKEGRRTNDELRKLWKTAIRQTILLARMEKENARLQARQNENEIKKIKLDYDEILPCDKQAIERWEIIIERDSLKISNKKDPKVLLQSIKNGVPRSKRGEVWNYLAEQYSMYTAPVDIKKFPNFNTPYEILLKNLTEHQHAILIDLGRTFPNHKYYKAALGVGQLSLFNLLKAYSILDPELGYCQGLGFICGVLLLHCEEAEAFHLLKHLMFHRRMREKYLPDMKKFQLQLYQLSRLVKDHLPDLYNWLDKNDVSPTLYAAPWILTVFSSQFPLGFVARIFDLLFFESSEAIFKIALSLLSLHQDNLLAKDNFEEIMDYLKNNLPKINAEDIDKIMKNTFGLDISKQLIEYQVEYNVLQEEITTTNYHLETLNKERNRNQHLEAQLQFAQSSIAQLEKTRCLQQNQISTLQTQVQGLEVTIQTLGRYLLQLNEKNRSLEYPGDIRRILQQIDELEKQRKKPIFIERKIGKSVSVNSNLGFPLKVLEELNEKDNDTSPVKKKTPFFENTYEHIRQQRANQRPNRLIETKLLDDTKISINIEKCTDDNPKSPNEFDSGVCTPLTPHDNQQILKIQDRLLEKNDTFNNNNNNNNKNDEMHPLSMCGDVNFKFNGTTTQLKSIRSTHIKNANFNLQTTLNTENNSKLQDDQS